MAQLKVLARTVDLLGRQQIATVQNAVMELFKNAYDAGASYIRVDYLTHFCKDGSDLISVRDDGDGMTLEDFNNKWLVIGTDNKVDSVSRRNQTGEKGIGRLSIALLGNIVLVLSLAKETGRCVASLIHWGIFQLEKLDIEDIDFPVIEIGDGRLPSAQELEGLRRSLVTTLDRYRAKSGSGNSSLLASIEKDVQQFILDTQSITGYLSRYETQGISGLTNINSGTWFIIGNPSEMMRSALADEVAGGRSKRNTGFSSMLQAFTDQTFTGQDSHFVTYFNVWKDNAFFPDEILTREGFVSHEELINGMDYFIKGTIDAEGRFLGTLKSVDAESRHIEISPPANIGITDCGSFRFCFGTVQWQKELSLVAKKSMFDYDAIIGKLSGIGGIYIYRDGIRILPYGSQLGGDWLEIERHRVHLLGRYFLSRHNMLGAVLLSRSGNHKLQEKAGREGFQKNRAYKQLRDIVINILMVLSREYLSINKDELAAYQRRQDEIHQRRMAIRELERQNRVEIRKFEQRMRRVIEDAQEGAPERAIQECLNKFGEEISKAIPDGYPVKFYVLSLQTLPEETYAKIDRIREQYTVEYPLGIAVPLRLQAMWQKCEEIIERQDREVFLAAKSKVAELINKTIEPLEKLQRTGVLERQFTAYLDAGLKVTNDRILKAKGLVQDFSHQCEEIINTVLADVKNICANATMRWRNGVENMSPHAFVNWQQDVFKSLTSALNPCDALEALLRRVLTLIDKSEVKGALDVFGALQQAVSDYKANAEEDFEMIQKGVAVSIIEHEFFSTTSEIYSALKELSSLARMVPAIRPMSDRIRTGFSHLDSFIRVLEPLQKRVHSNEEEISGKKILAYLRRAFGARYERDNIQIQKVGDFDGYVIRIAPAALYPVLVNLVDNALYWLGTITGNRKLVLEIRENEIIVSNNGPRIEDELTDLIFTKGFSLKPGGRGLGLYIAKEVLHDSGFEIHVCEPYEGCNAAFGIKHRPKAVTYKD